jgi:hypothetical protein
LSKDILSAYGREESRQSTERAGRRRVTESPGHNTCVSQLSFPAKVVNNKQK